MILDKLFYIITPIFLVIVSWFALEYYRRKSKIDGFPKNYHAVISGGSKGIGKALAVKFAEGGANVTIIARNEADLEKAQKDIEGKRMDKLNQVIKAISLDLTKFTPEKEKKYSKIVKNIIGEDERVDAIINCCGSSIPGRFIDLSHEQFKSQMDVNYFSAVNLTKALLPTMQKRSARMIEDDENSEDCGTIIFVSSICGLLSFYGYSAYSASKFALVGLAQALQMELRPFKIGVMLSFPGDTDTPGYEEENQIKPKITRDISKASSIADPGMVAESIIRDMKAKKFFSTVGTEGALAILATNTFMPNNFIDVLIESTLACFVKVIGYFFVSSWNKMVDDNTKEELASASPAARTSKDK